MNNTKKGQSRPALLRDNPSVYPVDDSEDMLVPADTDDFEIVTHDSLTELVEEESFFSPDSLQDYDMLLEPEDEKSIARDIESLFADNISAADHALVVDDSVGEDEASAPLDLPVELTFYDLIKKDEVDTDLEELEQSQDDSLLFNEFDDAVTINDTRGKDTNFDDLEALLDDDYLGESELDVEAAADDSLEQYPHAEEPEGDILLSDEQLYGVEDAGDTKVDNDEGLLGGDSGEQCVLDYDDLIEPDLTAEDETKENLEAVEQERPDDDSILFAEQLHGFEGDEAVAEDPALDSFAALPDDDGPASDELDDALDDFFARADNTSSDLDNFAELLDDNSSGESGFIVEPTSDIIESDLTAEDETKENLEAVEQERPDDDSILFAEQLHGVDDSAAEDPVLDSFAALPDDDGPASDELDDALDDFFTRDDNTRSDLDNFAELLDDNSSGESGFIAEPTSDIFEPDLTTVDETTEDHEETETVNVVSPDTDVEQPIIVPNTNEEVVSGEVSEQMVTDQLSKKWTPERVASLPLVAAIVKSGASIKQGIRESVAGSRHSLVAAIVKSRASIKQGIRESVAGSSHYAVKLKKRSLIVLAVLVVLGGAWYSYNNIGDGSHTLQQQADDRQQQVSRKNLDDHPELEVTGLNQPEPTMPESSDSGKAPVNEPKQQVSEQLENNSGKLIDLLQTTRQLDRPLSAEEQKMIGYGNSDQSAQVSNQLKVPGQMQFIETNQPGVAEKIALQAGQQETDIGQLENQVRQLQQEQSTVRNAISSAEQKTVASTAAPAAIKVETGLEQEQQPATVSESITAGDVSGPAEKRTSDSLLPNIIEVKETISFRPDKPILSEVGTAKQTGWAVNISSFRKRSLAEKEQKRLNGQGLKTVIRKALVQGTIWFRVRIEGFSSRRAAWKYINLHLDHKRFKGAWVSKNSK